MKPRDASDTLDGPWTVLVTLPTLPPMTRTERLARFETVDLYPVTCQRLSEGRGSLEILDGIIAGGANVCVFTTGRGSVYGSKPVPCIKIATNTPLYVRMEDDMAIDAGRVLGGVPLEEVGREIFEEILAVASGKRTKSEAQGVGEEEFSPWVVGPVL